MTKKTSDSSKRVIFVNRFYAPDLSATSQILTDVATHLASEGFNVTVFCSRSSYDGSVTYKKLDEIDNVQVHRLTTSAFGRGHWVGRGIDYLTFYVSVCVHLMLFARKDDILVAKTDPPMLSVPLGLVARLKQAVLINWLQDVFPEVALNIGGNHRYNRFVKVLLDLRNRSLRKAYTNVVIGVAMQDAVRQMGVPSNKLKVIHNFVDDEQINLKNTFAQELRKRWGLQPDEFVVGYSGNLGRAHDLDTMLSAATDLKDYSKIKFLFIGGGYLRDRLQAEIKSRGLSNILLKPYLPREALPESLSLPNLHWASLIPSLEGYIVPSKIYGVAAAGRPLMMIGDPNGEIAQLISQHDFGVAVRNGDVLTVKTEILRLASDPRRTLELGRHARAFIDQHASRKRAREDWQSLIAGVESATLS